MKKLILFICTLAIIVLICFGGYQGVLGRFLVDTSGVNKIEYEKLYYYNQLTDKQQEIYVEIDLAIKEMKKTIALGYEEKANIKLDIAKVMEAITKDRPQYYYLTGTYHIRNLPVIKGNFVYVDIGYNIESVEEKTKMDRELERKIEQFLYETITDDMSDIEKQIAIHDKLVKHVEYYKYIDINSIPYKMHTAYEALVNKQAVCDGISKALMMLLNEAGIETIVVAGYTEGEAHAWNVVKMDGECYHIDATSNKIEIDNEKQVIHRYFNVTDENIQITHTISDEFDIPKCNGTKYNYYEYKDYAIRYLEYMRSKVAEIMDKQADSEILEIKLDDTYSLNDLLEALLYNDFNNWNTNHTTKVAYHKLEDIYIFKNEKVKK